MTQEAMLFCADLRIDVDNESAWRGEQVVLS